MIILRPTEAQIAQAKEEGRKMGVLPNSNTCGRGNAIGMLAEITTAEWLNAERVRPPVYTHDLVLNGKTIDVKCKRCSSAPQPNYSASVFAKHGKHGIAADILLFTRVLDDMSELYVVGWLTTRQFARRASFVKAGTREDGFLHRADGFHVPISRLLGPLSLAAGS